MLGGRRSVHGHVLIIITEAILLRRRRSWRDRDRRVGHPSFLDFTCGGGSPTAEHELLSLVALLESHNHRARLVVVGFDRLVLTNTLEHE